MQKLLCVQHKNIKGLQEGYTWDIIKKYVLLLCAMVKLEEIKDMPKGSARPFSGNNREILWAVCGSDYNRFIVESEATIATSNLWDDTLIIPSLERWILSDSGWVRWKFNYKCQVQLNSLAWNSLKFIDTKFVSLENLHFNQTDSVDVASAFHALSTIRDRFKPYKKFKCFNLNFN